MTTSTDRKPSNKVAKLIDQYDLVGLGGELKMYWMGNGVERMSLRDLAAYFNKRLLEAKMEAEGMSLINNDVDTVYRNLTSDDVSAGYGQIARTNSPRTVSIRSSSTENLSHTRRCGRISRSIRMPSMKNYQTKIKSRKTCKRSTGS